MIIFSSRLGKTSRNENRRSCEKSYELHKNPSLHFEQHCPKLDHASVIFIWLFFSQTNQVFKFNLVLIGVLVCWIIFATIYFPVCRLIITCYFIHLEVQQSPYTFVNKNRNDFEETKCFLFLLFLFSEGWQHQNVVIILFFPTNSCLSTAKITPDVTNCLNFTYRASFRRFFQRRI